MLSGKNFLKLFRTVRNILSQPKTNMPNEEKDCQINAQDSKPVVASVIPVDLSRYFQHSEQIGGKDTRKWLVTPEGMTYRIRINELLYTYGLSMKDIEVYQSDRSKVQDYISFRIEGFFQEAEELLEQTQKQYPTIGMRTSTIQYTYKRGTPHEVEIWLTYGTEPKNAEEYFQLAMAIYNHRSQYKNCIWFQDIIKKDRGNMIYTTIGKRIRTKDKTKGENEKKEDQRVLKICYQAAAVVNKRNQQEFILNLCLDAARAGHAGARNFLLGSYRAVLIDALCAGHDSAFDWRLEQGWTTRYTVRSLDNREKKMFVWLKREPQSADDFYKLALNIKKNSSNTEDYFVEDLKNARNIVKTFLAIAASMGHKEAEELIKKINNKQVTFGKTLDITIEDNNNTKVKFSNKP